MRQLHKPAGSSFATSAMTDTFAEIREGFVALNSSGREFFVKAEQALLDTPEFYDDDPDALWNFLPEELQQVSRQMQRELLRLVGALTGYVTRAPLLSEADERDLSKSAKEVRAALKLRAYRAWDTEILNDEDIVLGVRPAGQSDAHHAQPQEASREFLRGMNTITAIIELVEASPDPTYSLGRRDPDASKYRPNTVFVMMWIDPQNPNLQDIYNTIKESCSKFGLNALRADEIEHEEVITERILSEIKTSEFLIADLTGERPSVYYEIGYAHAIGKRVIMYRKEGVNVHFDVAAYNCPEYKNNTELKERLTRRLQDVTNRRGTGG